MQKNKDTKTTHLMQEPRKQAGDQEEEGQMPLYIWSSDLYPRQASLTED